MKKILLVILCLGLFGCAALEIDSSIAQYNKVAGQIKLGDSKDDVLALLNPTQQGLSGGKKKTSDMYMEGSDTVEIYYFRSGRQPDGLTTDDEFTPYIFKNSKLIGVGWAMLGGAKSHGQVIQPPDVTNVNVNQTQKTTIY